MSIYDIKVYIRAMYIGTPSKISLKSAEEFLEKLRSIYIKGDEIMISFNIVNLYLSIINWINEKMHKLKA